MQILYVMLQAAPQSQGGGSMLLMLGLLFVIMWLLMIRPQQKQQKREAEMRKNLKKGDRVTFSGGIYGKIHQVNETTVEVEVSNGVILTVEKNFIQAVGESESNKPAEKK